MSSKRVAIGSSRPAGRPWSSFLALSASLLLVSASASRAAEGDARCWYDVCATPPSYSAFLAAHHFMSMSACILTASLFVR